VSRNVRDAALYRRSEVIRPVQLALSRAVGPAARAATPTHAGWRLTAACYATSAVA